jgi:hypothetical protein
MFPAVRQVIPVTVSRDPGLDVVAEQPQRCAAVLPVQGTSDGTHLSGDDVLEHSLFLNYLTKYRIFQASILAMSTSSLSST